jgi:hypothetical protein
MKVDLEAKTSAIKELRKEMDDKIKAFVDERSSWKQREGELTLKIQSMEEKKKAEPNKDDM